MHWNGPLKQVGEAVPRTWAESVRQFNEWMDLGLNLGAIRLTLGRLLAALLVLVILLFVSSLLKRLFRRYAKRNKNINQSAVYTVERLTHYLLLVIGVLLALHVTGIPVAQFAVFAGAIGVGLGFGLQSIFNNFVSGLILLFERSLRVGDFVELASGVHGHVRDIHIRTTRVSTNDNIDILVPNSEFVNGRVVNWTLQEVARRLKVPFGVAYGTDKELVKRAALEAAAEVPFTLALDGPRAPQVWLTGFGDSSLNFNLVVWLNAEATRRPAAVTAAYYWALHSALEKYEIEIPFPQRDLNIKSWVKTDEAHAGQPPVAKPSVLQNREPTDNDAARDVTRDIAEETASRRVAEVPSAPRPDGTPANNPDVAR